MRNARLSPKRVRPNNEATLRNHNSLPISRGGATLCPNVTGQILPYLSTANPAQFD